MVPAAITSALPPSTVPLAPAVAPAAKLSQPLAGKLYLTITVVSSTDPYVNVVNAARNLTPSAG
jgi:hypothetical protein